MSQPVTMVKVSIDGREAEVPSGTTIFEAAAKVGIKIPVLCHREYMNPVAVCRVCAVDVGERVLAPACYRQITPEMADRQTKIVKIITSDPSLKALEGSKDAPGVDAEILAKSDRVRGSVKTLVELLMADHPSPCAKHRDYHDCELELMAEAFDVGTPRFPKGPHRERDDSSVIIAVDHASCILCDRCVRGCNDIKDNQVLGRMGKGFTAQVAFDLNNLMGNSSCVSCGECMISCPTGALINRTSVTPPPPPGAGVVPPEELIQLPLFAGVSHPPLQRERRTPPGLQERRGHLPGGGIRLDRLLHRGWHRRHLHQGDLQPHQDPGRRRPWWAVRPGPPPDHRLREPQAGRADRRDLPPIHPH
jgi:ferredoxin